MVGSAYAVMPHMSYNTTLSIGKGDRLSIICDAQMDGMTADNGGSAVTGGGDCVPSRQLPLLEKVATAYAAARSAASEAAAAG